MFHPEDKNCPIFVNYHKEDDISDTTKYEDGFIDIVVEGTTFERPSNPKRIVTGTVFLSTGKFTYDTIHPDDRKNPLAEVGDCSGLTKCIDN